MTPPNPFAAKLLETSSSAYAAYAANLLLERRPEVGERLGPAGFRTWKAHLTQRIQELSAALAAGEPQLLVARVGWARRAFGAREAPEQDLRASLSCLADVLREELPAVAQEAACGYLARALEAFDKPLPADAGLDPEKPGDKLALEYLQAALEGDARRAIAAVAAAVDAGLGVEQAYLEVLLPAQREAGRMWHLDEISIAEEHAVTATTRRAMAILCHRAACRPPHGKTMIAAAVAGNVHDIGVQAVADFFELAGWRAVCLGADVPSADVAAAARYFDASLVVLSAALATHLETVREAVAAVRAAPESAAKVMVGGVAFSDSPELWRALGADGYAPTAADAVRVGAGLVGLE